MLWPVRLVAIRGDEADDEAAIGAPAEQAREVRRERLLDRAAVDDARGAAPCRCDVDVARGAAGDSLDRDPGPVGRQGRRLRDELCERLRERMRRASRHDPLDDERRGPLGAMRDSASADQRLAAEAGEEAARRELPAPPRPDVEERPSGLNEPLRPDPEVRRREPEDGRRGAQDDAPAALDCERRPASRNHGGAAGERQPPALDRQQRMPGRVEAIPPLRSVKERRVETGAQEAVLHGRLRAGAARMDGEAGQPDEPATAQVAERDPAALLVDEPLRGQLTQRDRPAPRRTRVRRPAAREREDDESERGAPHGCGFHIAHASRATYVRLSVRGSTRYTPAFVGRSQ